MPVTLAAAIIAAHVHETNLQRQIGFSLPPYTGLVVIIALIALVVYAGLRAVFR